MSKKSFWLWVLLVALFAGGCYLLAADLFGAQLVKRSGGTTIVGGCDESLNDHIYHPKRLQVLGACESVTGTWVDASHGKNKDGCRHEADSDAHCFLKLDPGQKKYLNAKNISNEDGNLVIEPTCFYARVTQEDAKAACKNWRQKITLPPVGAHVRVTGRWVLDAQHGHLEIHAPSSIEVLK